MPRKFQYQRIVSYLLLQDLPWSAHLRAKLSSPKVMDVHTVNFGSKMVQAKHVSRKNIFCSMDKEKIREKIIFEIVHCPFEGPAQLHHLCQPNGPTGRCQLGGNWKGQCTISKIIFPLHLYTFIEQNIFFPETCFAYPISEQKFTV